jgi:hypothetical protein
MDGKEKTYMTKTQIMTTRPSKTPSSFEIAEDISASEAVNALRSR